MRRTTTAAAFAVLSIVAAAAPTREAQAQPLAPAPSPPPPVFAPDVDDPLLVAPPPAATALASWAEAQRLFGDGATEVRRAQIGERRAAAQVRAARAASLPTVQGSAALSLDLLHPGTAPGVPPGPDYTPTSPLLSAALSATQPLLDRGARHGRRAALAGQRGAALERVDAERRVALRVAQAMIAVVATERAAELNRLGLRQALGRAALGQRTFQLGAATELDVVRTQQDVALARAALIAGDEQLRAAREGLGLALGVDGEVGVRPGLVGEPLLAELAARCRPLRGDEARADLAAAEADVEAARARRDQADAAYWPSVDLTTSVAGYTTDPAPGRVPSWTVALVLSVPIWEGGVRAATVAERAAVEADTIAVVDDLRRAVRVELARAHRGGEVATALVGAAADARALAVRVDTMTRRSFEIGRATSLELVQSAAALRQAELTLSLREFERLAAQVDALLTEARCVP